LRQVLAAPGAPRSIAIFYGAAHMPDFEKTLQEEFKLAPRELSWHRAMFVDEWSVKRIKARRDKLASERDALVKAGSANQEKVTGIEGQIAELESRIRSRTAAGD
jgi:hypothetical protein